MEEARDRRLLEPRRGSPGDADGGRRRILDERRCAVILKDTLKTASEDALVELIQSGVNMRKAQRDYFKFRGREMLYAAKEAEDRFDRALRAVVNCGDITQPTIL